MKSNPAAKLIQSIGAEETVVTLAQMPGSELHTLLLSVFAERARKLTPSCIEEQHRQNRFVAPCPVTQSRLVQADATAYGVVKDYFKGVECSPVMPFGTNAVLGGVNQRNVLTAIRGCEVLADPTTALALHCAQKRKTLLKVNKRDSTKVRLATSARCLRTQRFDDIPGFVPHFKIFALVTGGRDVGSEHFEVESLREHLRFHLDYLAALEREQCAFRVIQVDLSDVRIMREVVRRRELDPAIIGRYVQTQNFSVFERYGIGAPQRVDYTHAIPREFIAAYELQKPLLLLEKLETTVLNPLRKEYPYVEFGIDLDRAAGMNYYTDACFKIRATNSSDESYPLADGGMSDWAQRLLQSQKERLFTSGIGTELALANFPK